MHDRFLDLYNHNLPTKHNMNKIKTIHKPWITPGILKSIKNHKLYKQSLTIKTPIAISKYKKYKNKINKFIKYSQRQYYINWFESIKKNIKLTWCEIRRIINESKHLSVNELDVNGTSINDPESITNKFIEYFISIGPTFASKIETITDNPMKYNKPVRHSMFLQHCDDAEIINIVKLLSSNKASGFDDISQNVIKSDIPSIVQPITYKCN